MGRLIDTSELAKHIALQKKRFGNLLEVPICNVFADMIRDTPTAKAISKADYEARLKAEKIAMLKLLRLEADKLKGPQYNVAYWVGFFAYDDFVKEKINALKGDSND